MNYLKKCTDRLLIAIHGYKTPQKVIAKLPNYNYLLGNPLFKTKEIMITIQVTECELNNIIQALTTRGMKKQKRAESWLNRKENGSLIIPVEVADSFITIDNHTANGVIRPLIERLECTKAGLS